MSTNVQTSSKAVLGFDPYLVRYGSLFLLIVGTFGNIVSFIIFTYGTLRKSSTFRYLALLSLMDLLVLYSGLLDLFLTIEYRGTFSLRTLNPISCRLHTFITYWSQHSSSWILSFISVDRAIATNCIKFARKFCTPRWASYIVATILFLTALLNCHELIFLHLQSSDRNDYTTLSPLHSNQSVISLSQTFVKKRDILSICDNPSWDFLCLRTKREISTANITINIKPKTIDKNCQALPGSRYEIFWVHVWEWIDVCLYALIPFTVMSIGTFLIVYRVYYQQRRVFRSRRSGAHNSLSATPNKAKSLFYLLFTLNLLYFILVSPVLLVTTTLFRDRNEELAYPRFKATIYLMLYCNHSLNFIFYGITSPPYRRTLIEWFKFLSPYLPQCCQRTIQKRSRAETNNPVEKNHTAQTNKKLDEQTLSNLQKEAIALLPR